MSDQFDLFDVKRAYDQAGGQPLSNRQLYERVATNAGIDPQRMDRTEPIGRDGTARAPLKRKVRWFQQTLKQMGAIERVPGQRGVWALARDNGRDLHTPAIGAAVVAYSTALGAAVWADNRILEQLDEPIHLSITSPPYPLRQARRYGNVGEREWVSLIVRSLAPIVRHLVPGGSIVLNVSNDIFEPRRPSRSLYIERMVLALHDELGLSLMDRWPWVNLSKPPGPTHWACVNRQQLCSSWEPVFWFTNDPARVRSDNRRVLQAHSPRQKRLIERGGTERHAEYGDGAYTLRPGDFGAPTAGRIPKNVHQRGHACPDTQAIRRHARALGVAPHSAMFPTWLPASAIEFLTEPGELVVDLFAGANKTGLAAERRGRRWLAIEQGLEYHAPSAPLFAGCAGFEVGPAEAGLSPTTRSTSL